MSDLLKPIVFHGHLKDSEHVEDVFQSSVAKIGLG